MSSIEHGCGSVRARLETTDRAAAQFLSRVRELQEHHDTLKAQERRVSELLLQFQLTDTEMRALRETPLDEEAGAAAFFRALDRLREVREQSRHMLEVEGQTAAYVGASSATRRLGSARPPSSPPRPAPQRRRAGVAVGH